MARERKGYKGRAEEPSTRWFFVSNIVAVIGDRFGLPGLAIAYGIYFVESNATAEQKRAIIDTYILLHGIEVIYPVVVLAFISALLFGGQWYYYHRRLKVMKNELKRLGEWKTERQERQLGVSLHHSDSKED